MQQLLFEYFFSKRGVSFVVFAKIITVLPHINAYYTTTQHISYMLYIVNKGNNDKFSVVDKHLSKNI
jgi:hypothetical protein